VRVLAARLVHTGGTHGPCDGASLEASQDRSLLAAKARARRSPNTGWETRRETNPQNARPRRSKTAARGGPGALEQHWANLRAPIRKLENLDLHRIAVTTCERCVEAGGPPGIVWDTGIADNLWEDSLDIDSVWTEAAISRLTDQTLHRSWCRQRAGEYVSAFGLTVDGDDMLKIAKAIGVGAQKGRADVEAAGQRRL